MVSERRQLMLLFTVALLARLVFVVAYGLETPPVTWGDDVEYDAIARQLVADGTYENLWFPPGYPLFLAAVYALFGPHWALVRILQAGIGAVTCLLVYLLGKKLASPRVGLVAGFLLALYPGHVYQAWRLMAESLYMLLIVLALLSGLALLAAARKRYALGLGATLGLAGAVKSNLIPFPPLALLWVGGRLLQRRPRPLVAGGIMIVTFVLASLANPLANLIASRGEMALLPGNAGHTLWWSNNPQATGYFVNPRDAPEAQAFIAAQGLSEALASAAPLEKDRLYRRLAVSWVREHPGAFLVLAGRKLANAYGPFPHGQVTTRSPAARRVQFASWLAFVPFTLLGLWASRRQWEPYMLLYLLLLSHLLMVLVFYGTLRFTLLIGPALAIFAALGLWTTWDALVARTGRSAAS